MHNIPNSAHDCVNMKQCLEKYGFDFKTTDEKGKPKNLFMLNYTPSSRQANEVFTKLRKRMQNGLKE